MPRGLLSCKYKSKPSRAGCPDSLRAGVKVCYYETDLFHKRMWEVVDLLVLKEIKSQSRKLQSGSHGDQNDQDLEGIWNLSRGSLGVKIK